MKALTTSEAERDARLSRLLATDARQQQEAEARRDAVLTNLFKQAEQAERLTWRRAAEVKGPGGDTAYVVLGRTSTDPAHPTVDRQGDVLRPGLLRNPPGDRVPCSSWNHEYMRDPNAEAAGFATVTEVDGELRARVTFNDTAIGRATARRVRDELPDFSWGLAAIEAAPLTAAERAAGATRAIVGVTVVEVSPVDRAASVGTGVLSASCASCALAGVDGKCCAVAGGGVPPCHPRRRAQGARAAALSAAAERLAKEEAARIRAADDTRHATLVMLCLSAGEPLPVRWGGARRGPLPRWTL